MRDLKFRAWDKVNKKISLPFNIYEYSEDQDSEYGRFHFPSIEDGGCEIMQFTGHKDKNGKEIYEGDICSIGFNVQIKWDEEKARFGFSYVGGNSIMDQFWHRCPKDIIVIGNLYENPELMTDSKA